MTRFLRQLALLVLLVLPVQAAFAGGFRATFVNPGKSDEHFWVSVSDFMAASAKSLGIQLEVLYAERDHLRAQELVRNIAARPVHPDYLIVVNEKLAAGDMVKVADKAGIKTFILLSTFEDAQATEFGRPRQKYKNWLGSLTPDYIQVGAITAKTLIDTALAARPLAANTKLQFLAIGGDRSTPASVQRLAGMVQAVRQYPQVELQQTTYANWERARAKDQVAQLLARYPKTVAIWSANDLMAFGAMDAAKAAGHKVGQDIFFSGVNNSPAAMAAVQDGSLAALGAGHFMAGGWALVMLYDYHNGRDFATEGLELRRPLFGLIEKADVAQFNAHYGGGLFPGMDFKLMSKVHQPKLKAYPFEFSQILR